MKIALRDIIRIDTRAKFTYILNPKFLCIFLRYTNHGIREIDTQHKRGALLSISQAKAAGSTADIQNSLTIQGLQCLYGKFQSSANNTPPYAIDEALYRALFFTIDSVEPFGIIFEMTSNAFGYSRLFRSQRSVPSVQLP